MALKGLFKDFAAARASQKGAKALTARAKAKDEQNLMERRKTALKTSERYTAGYEHLPFIGAGKKAAQKQNVRAMVRSGIAKGVERVNKATGLFARVKRATSYRKK